MTGVVRATVTRRNHVDESYDPAFLDRFEAAVAETTPP
jgi:hypothetical protein